jgi:hypothetical protein
MLKMCEACWAEQERIGGYLQSSEKVTDVKVCQVHPALGNPRVLRTMKTIKTWSLEAAGHVHPHCKISPITPEAGHVHQRVAKAVLFDYEAPFIDLLVYEGLLERHEGTPTTLTVTKKGDDWLRQQIAKQAA